jgi:uncharacterized protein YbjT (DUF2867 family)
MGATQSTVLLAGATGALGRHVTEALAARGWTVRALARSAARAHEVKGVAEVHVGNALDRSTLVGAFEGVSVVFSCVGASLDPSPLRGRSSYLSVDLPANVNLIEEARRAGIERFVYVSLHHDEPMRRSLRYVEAHARVEDHLRASGLDARVLRPTGFFSAFAKLFDLARRGPVPLFGDGQARSNPIHDADLAEACADAVEGKTPATFALGGPDILTRRQMLELAFEALHTPLRTFAMPLALVDTLCTWMRPFFPRTSDITRFVTYVSTHDCIAPTYGSRTLAAYYRQRAAASS